MKKQMFGKHSFRCRFSSLLAAVLLITGSAPLPVYADQETEIPAETADLGEDTTEEVRRKLAINNESDLLTFAENCKLGDYSVNLEVELNADLDLSLLENGEFQGITSFSGIFYGNGHTVKGLSLENGSETLGFFKYIEKGAVVKALTVKGNISSTDSNNCIGGIAGINAGNIIDCMFYGVITGTGITGGIAGLNGAGGSISRCITEGTISSIHSVGGTVGHNRGVISDCINRASVNSDDTWLELESDSSLSLSLDSILNTVEENWQNGTDIGGIAGYSDGVIAGCTNKGTVGYNHFGKNVGGIAGRQSGEIIRCTNSGKVYGKQDVGGVVGQLEPDTTLEEMEELDQEVDKLHDLMDQMIDDMDALKNDMHKDLDDLNDTSREASDTTDALLDEMRDVTKKNIDVVNELSRRIDYTISHFAVVMRYVNTALDKMDLVVDDIDHVRNDLNIKEQMENSDFDEAKSKRLVLLSGIGGSLSSDNINPAEGTTVTVTVKADHGYALEKLTLTPYQGSSTDVTAAVSGKEYSFTMPAANTTIAATFCYVGEYIAESNEGGRVSVAEGDDTVKIRVFADGDYLLSALTVGGEDIMSDLTADVDDSSVLTATENKIISDRPILVKAVFVKKDNTHNVHIVTGTGGTVTADKTAAAEGETVTLTVNTLSGYTVSGGDLSVKNGTASVPYTQSGEREYEFLMPGADADVEAVFGYTPSENDKIYAVSNAGGTVAVLPVPGSNDYRVTIVPDSGYLLADSGTVMTITDSAGAVTNIEKSALEENSSSYTYTINLNNYYVSPTAVKVAVTFSKETEINCSVRVVSGTGGAAAVSSALVKAGDEVTIVVTNEAHYRLNRLLIETSSGEEDITSSVSEGKCTYTIPDSVGGNLVVRADFDPVLLVITSQEAGGSAAFAVTDQDVLLTLTQNTGYKPVEPLKIMDSYGKQISCEKQYADSYIYKFAVTANMKNLQPAALAVTYEKQADKEAFDEAKDQIERQSDELSASADRMSNSADKIQDILTDEYGGTRSAQDLSNDEITELEDDIVDMAGYLADAAVAAGEVLNSAVTIERIASPYLEDAMDNADRDLDKLVDDANAMNDAMQSAGDEMQGIVDYLDALDRLEAVNLSDNFDRNSDRLKEEMDDISDILDRMNDSFYYHSEKLESDMRAVNDQLNVVFQLLIDKIDNIEALTSGENVIVDHSADDLNANDASRISYSDNTGSVFGDHNVGGIAGNIEIEGMDSQDDQTTLKVGGKYNTKAVVQNCSNSGFVTVKNENAGGIAGKVDVGYLFGCVGSGKVSSETGNNIGGIAGSSTGTIDKCSSLAVLAGGKYIGGIAGKADKITYCYSMASILSSDGFIGAIAGIEETDDEDDLTIARFNMRERIHDNYYVSSRLFGINGVSYAKVAEPLTYEQLLTKEYASNEFRHLKAVFVDMDKNPVKQTSVKYGDSISTLQYPQIKTEQGDYVEWEGIDTDVIEGNLVIEAVETSNVTILSSDEKVDTKAVVLAEGIFTGSASVNIEEITAKLPADLPENAVCHVYRVTLDQTGVRDHDTTRIRLLNLEGKKTVVYGISAGKTVDSENWEELEAYKLGSYVEVSMTGTEGIFCVASYEPKLNVKLYAAVGGCAAAVFVAVFSVIKLKKRQKISKD